MSGHSDQPAKAPLIPSWIIYLVVIGVVLSWLPLALISRSRSMRSPNRPVHMFLDMDVQPKYKAQAVNPAFADRRSERPPIEGTVSQSDGPAIDDDHFFRGYETDGNGNPIRVGAAEPKTNKYFNDFPKQIAAPYEASDKLSKEDAEKLNREHTALLLKRGQERYGIYCAVCHGDSGFGDGIIKQRADQLNAVYSAVKQGAKPEEYPAANFGVPRNLHDEGARAMSVGQLFNIVSQGSKNMRGYAAQVSVEDRWAIVAYVKALQLAQTFPSSQVAQLPKEIQKQVSELK